MTPRNFKKPGSINNKKPSYLRYDDVFMSKKSNHGYDEHLNRAYPPKKNPFSNDHIDRQSFENESFQSDSHRDDFNEEHEYFSDNEKNIIDERMIKYQKRQLPPLQRYGSNNPKDMYEEYHSSSSYWDGYENDNRQKPGRYKTDGSFLKSIWQKFLITFGSILLLVCVSWIAYNCGNNGNKATSRENIVIEPEVSTFKVLPDNPGGSNVPHQDKMIYDRINGQESPLSEQENQLLPPQEIPSINDQEVNVDEYSILDEKTYYIKIASNKNKEALTNELGVVKAKYSNQIGALSCSIKTVRGRDGEKKYAMLIGPIESKEQAVKIAKELNTDCSVISVKE